MVDSPRRLYPDDAPPNDFMASPIRSTNFANGSNNSVTSPRDTVSSVSLDLTTNKVFHTPTTVDDRYQDKLPDTVVTVFGFRDNHARVLQHVSSLLGPPNDILSHFIGGNRDSSWICIQVDSEDVASHLIDSINGRFWNNEILGACRAYRVKPGIQALYSFIRCQEHLVSAKTSVQRPQIFLTPNQSLARQSVESSETESGTEGKSLINAAVNFFFGF